MIKNYALSSSPHADIILNDGRLWINLPILNDVVCFNVVKS